VTTEQASLAATGALAIALALVAVLLAVRAQRRAARAEARVVALAERLAALESPAPEAEGERVVPAPSAFVITRMDGPEPGRVPVARPIEGRLFADIVARETVVKAASWTHGLRRALSSESRNRIRFEVRRETKRAGRARRTETKQALREYRARERAVTGGHRAEAGEDVA
jgi:hypothetical protein